MCDRRFRYCLSLLRCGRAGQYSERRQCDFHRARCLILAAPLSISLASTFVGPQFAAFIDRRRRSRVPRDRWGCSPERRRRRGVLPSPSSLLCRSCINTISGFPPHNGMPRSCQSMILFGCSLAEQNTLNFCAFVDTLRGRNTVPIGTESRTRNSTPPSLSLSKTC